MTTMFNQNPEECRKALSIEMTGDRFWNRHKENSFNDHNLKTDEYLTKWMIETVSDSDVCDRYFHNKTFKRQCTHPIVSCQLVVCG